MTGKLSYCGELVRANDPDRFLTCLFAPADRRENLFTLYAFNHEIAKTREMVREPMMGRIRLQWWREGISQLYDGKVRDHKVLQALASVLPGKINEMDVQALIEAREMDLEESPPTTGGVLVEYTRVTGGGLMAMAARLLGVTGKPELEMAEDMGEAVALTGLLRAVPHHAAQGRVYLPADLMRQMGVDPAMRQTQRPMGIDVVTYLLATEAERLLEERKIVERCHIAAYLPATLARLYLKRLEHLEHDPFDARNLAPFPLKPVILAKAWLNGRP